MKSHWANWVDLRREDKGGWLTNLLNLVFSPHLEFVPLPAWTHVPCHAPMLSKNMNWGEMIGITNCWVEPRKVFAAALADCIFFCCYRRRNCTWLWQHNIIISCNTFLLKCFPLKHPHTRPTTAPDCFQSSWGHLAAVRHACNMTTPRNCENCTKTASTVIHVGSSHQIIKSSSVRLFICCGL